MELTNIIKSFEFAEYNRETIDISGGLRLNPGSAYDAGNLELPVSGDGYDTSTNLYCRTWMANPRSVRAWIGFEVKVIHGKFEDEIVTNAYYKLNDGTDDLYWDGAAWSVAGTNDWSSEAEIANNISTFPVVNRSISIVVNLRSSSRFVTPKLYQIKLLYAASIDHLDDYIHRSLVRELKANIRPFSRAIVAHAGGVSVPFTSYKPVTPYDVKSVDAVFDEDNDPDHLVDLFASYNVSTKEVTLASDPGTTNLFIRFAYQPLIAVSTSRDFYEVSKLPSVQISNISLQASYSGQNDSVVNKDASSGVLVYAPTQGNLEFELLLSADKMVDLMNLSDAVRKYMNANPFITSIGMDEKFRLWLVNEYASQGSMDFKDRITSRVRGMLAGVVFYDRGSKATGAVTTVASNLNQT